MTNRSTLFLAAGSLLVLVLVRTFISGWGPPQDPAGSELTAYGLAAYPADNLSYAAWAEQAKGGRWLFGNLYTTNEHARLMFNSLFLLVGQVSALLAVGPLLVLNVLAAFALPIFILSFSTMCRSLGLGGAATFAATCLAIGGGGTSWIRRTIEWSGSNRILPVGPSGPDLYFYDVYPAVAYFVAPYHAISLAIVAVLALVIVRYDDHEKKLALKEIALLSAVALLLATVRPHISIVVLGAYCTTTATTLALGLPGRILIRRTVIAACLAVAMVPPVLYSLWVSQQPVWSSFAEAHRTIRHDWAIGFFLLWILAGAGIGVLGSSRALRSSFAFLVFWALGSGALLLILNGHIYPKLCAGSTIALAALAGIVVDKYSGRLPSRRSLTAGVAAIAFLALLSPGLMILGVVRDRVRAPAELFQVIETIRNDAGAPFPSVLTDCGTGTMLPGLGGHKVFCGHWALTINNRQKIVLLSNLGFLAESQTIPSFPGVHDADIALDAAALLDHITGNTFQYLLVRKNYRIYQEFHSLAPGCTVHSGAQYLVLRMCSEVKTALQTILRI